jgi:hypothetical protein
VPKFTSKQIRELAIAAHPTCEDDYGSNRQVDAQTAFAEAVESRLTPVQAEVFWRSVFKATTEEMLEDALKYLGIPPLNDEELRLHPLRVEFNAWLKANDIQWDGDAEELLGSDRVKLLLTAEHRTWLTEFIERWAAASMG